MTKLIIEYFYFLRDTPYKLYLYKYIHVCNEDIYIFWVDFYTNIFIRYYSWLASYIPIENIEHWLRKISNLVITLSMA